MVKGVGDKPRRLAATTLIRRFTNNLDSAIKVTKLKDLDWSLWMPAKHRFWTIRLVMMTCGEMSRATTEKLCLLPTLPDTTLRTPEAATPPAATMHNLSRVVDLSSPNPPYSPPPRSTIRPQQACRELLEKYFLEENETKAILIWEAVKLSSK